MMPLATVADRTEAGRSADMVFVTDELPGLLPAHDTSVALMEAAQLRGHRVLVTTASQLGFRDGMPVARCTPVTLRPAVLHDGKWIADPDWYTLGEAVRYPLNHAAAIFMRADPPVDAGYLRATYLLDLVDPRRTLLVNSSAGVRNANEKLFGLQAPELGPPTLVSADRQEIRAAVARWGRAVLKPTDWMGGRGILVLCPADPNLSSLLDSATERGRTQVVVQQWISACSEGDRRVIVLDGEPVGVIRRVAGPGDFRCNMATGAVPVADVVTERDRAICARLAPLLRENGLIFTGIDVIGGLLTEVNVTSPTGIREIDALTGSHLAADVIAWTEAHCPALAEPASSGSTSA
jgi:glutathione synthase